MKNVKVWVFFLLLLIIMPVHSLDVWHPISELTGGTSPLGENYTFNAYVNISAYKNNSVPLTIYANNTQTSNITEWRDYSNNILMHLTSIGNVFIQKNLSIGTIISGVWQGSTITQAYLGLTPNITALNNSLNLFNTRQSNDNTTQSIQLNALNNSLAGKTLTANNITNGTFGSGNFVFQNNLTISNNVLFVLNSTARVGINTISPDATLHIMGNIISTGTIFGQLSAGNLTNINLLNYGILVSQANISGITIPASNVTGKDYTLLVSQANITGITIPMANVTGRNYGVLVSQANISGITIPFDNTTGQVSQSRISGITIPANNVTNGTFASTNYVFPENVSFMNRIGIGTTGPGHKLTIAGGSTGGVDALHIDGSTSGAGIVINNTAASGGWVQLYNRDSQSGELRIRTGSSTTDVMTITSGGNVGIGTATPQRLLHLTGAGQDVSGNNQYGGMLSIMSNDAQAINTGGSLSFGGKYTDAGDYYTWSAIRGLKSSSTSGNADGHLAFYTRGGGQVTTERMRITDTGNVGIGSTSPTTALYVNGTVNATRFYSQRTRSFWLPPKLFLATEGTPVLVTYGVSASESAEAWAFDAATQESIGYAFQLPADWVTGSAVVFEFIWAADTATSGDTVWFFAVNSIADADSIDETWAYNPSLAVTAPATARTQKTTLVSSVAGSYFAAGSTIRLRVVRIGNNGADTMTGDALLLGVRIEYTADM